jgi:hypothetical protein
MKVDVERGLAKKEINLFARLITTMFLWLFSFNGFSQNTLIAIPSSGCEGYMTPHVYYFPNIPNDKQVAYYQFEVEGVSSFSTVDDNFITTQLPVGTNKVYANVKYTDSTTSPKEITGVTVYETPVAILELTTSNSGFVVNINNCFKKPVFSYPFNSLIDWGDGTLDTNYCHTYTQDGNQAIKLMLVSIQGCSSSLPDTIQVLKTVGVSEIEEKKYNFLITPNPTHNGIVNIVLPDKKMDIYSIAVYNIIGEKIYEVNRQQSSEISLSHLTDGVYFVTIRWNENSNSQKIIISR